MENQMVLDYDDVEFCTLFMTAYKISGEKAEKALQGAVTIAELTDWQKQNLSEFRSQWGNQAKAKEKLLSRFSRYSQNYADNVRWAELFSRGTSADISTESVKRARRIQTEETRSRTILWNLVNISHGSGSKAAVSFMQDFAGQMGIDRSVIQDFEDTLQAKDTLSAMRKWAKNTLDAGSAAKIEEQCAEDWRVLKMSINNMIDLG